MRIKRTFIIIIIIIIIKKNTCFQLIMGWTFRILTTIFVEIEFTWYKQINKRCRNIHPWDSSFMEQNLGSVQLFSKSHVQTPLWHMK